jgi:hypothetical protein|tara:strand:+ start:378 stop:635 length:258 start_codon:yes stop_codon:yes gene_type:complete
MEINMKYKSLDDPQRIGVCNRVYIMAKAGIDALQRQRNHDIYFGQLSLDIDNDSWFQNLEVKLYADYKILPASERGEYDRPYRVL